MGYFIGLLAGATSVLLMFVLNIESVPTTSIVTATSATSTSVKGFYFAPFPDACIGDTLIVTLHKKAVK